jgi:hydrogenase maturation protease
MKGKVLVAGIGNIFLGDDAFGVEVVQRLQQRTLPENVQVKDFGIRSYDLAYSLMLDWDLVILVDALPRGGKPGTIYTMEPELPAGDTAANIDAHTMNPVAALQLVSALGGKVGRLLVVGCEPGRLEPSPDGTFALTVPVSHAVAGAIEIIENLVARVPRHATAA